MDVKALLRLLQRYLNGERKAVSVVQIPTPDEEDQRRFNRERERLIKEHGAHIARIKSLLIQHGVRTLIGRNFPEWLETIGDGLGNELGPNLKTELVREYGRLQLLKRQIKELQQEQKRRASDLIRTDNELTRLLVKVRPNDQAGAGVYLAGLAADSLGKGDALKEKAETDKSGKKETLQADAIAFYRIAATAFWRSGSSKLVNELFAAANAGQELCAALANDAPDRDCLFLGLVIPFAGLEQHANRKGLAKELEDKTNFNDGQPASKDELAIMAEVGDALTESKKLVENPRHG